MGISLIYGWEKGGEKKYFLAFQVNEKSLLFSSIYLIVEVGTLKLHSVCILFRILKIAEREIKLKEPVCDDIYFILDGWYKNKTFTFYIKIG